MGGLHVGLAGLELHPLDRALVRIPNGLIGAYRDAIAGRRLAWSSPAVFTISSYLGFYGLGLFLSGPSQRPPIIAIAVAVGLAGLLCGIGLGWNAFSGPKRLQPVDHSLLTGYALILLCIGGVALLAYFAVIGYIPLLQAGLEQSRVAAAEEGGAPLRVLSLLALPGAWILVAQAAAARDRRRGMIAGIATVLIAAAFTLTGNRSPAFAAIEVALIGGLLAAGLGRLAARGILVLGIIGVVLVLGAGVFGAFRLASGSNVYGPPVPGERPPPPNYPALTAVAISGYLVVPIQNLGFTMDAVPDRISWRFGLTYLQPLLTVLPGRQTTFDADLKVALHQQYAGGGTVTGLLGEAYANFGPMGWFVVPLLAGAAIMALYRASQLGTPEVVVLYAYAIAHVSIGGVVSGLAIASVFPYEAYAVFGFAILGLPVIGRQIARRGGLGI